MMYFSLSLCVAFVPVVFASLRPTVQLRNGTVLGRHLPEFGQDLFLGVPFAEAPRLANPAPISRSWSSPFDVSQYGPSCYGFGSNQLLNLTQSEDCLNLNIVRPASQHANHSGLPVLLSIYGGGFYQGSSADPVSNLSYIVQQSVAQKQPIIAVSINYRLSFLGFPGGKQSQDAGIMNLGLKDQRAALQWVQGNIARFGGDPAKVTIWGESAGGLSVTSQAVSYGGTGGQGLFRGAIAVSGFVFGLASYKTVEGTQAGFDRLLANTNCTGAADAIACLRAAPLSAIYAVENLSPAPWGASIDGDFLRQQPAAEVTAGHVTRVPLILGHNADEGFSINKFYGDYYPNSTAELEACLHRLFPKITNRTVSDLENAYRVNGSAPPYVLPPDFDFCAALRAVNRPCGTQYRRYSGILGDFSLDAPRRYLATSWAKLGLPTYSFRFVANPTALPIHYFDILGPGFSLHAAELAYEFGLPAGFSTPINYYPEVKNVPGHIGLATEIIKKWIAFTVSGDPNDVKGRRPKFHHMLVEMADSSK